MSHPENTFRALKDLPLFVDRWQCRIGLHRWTKWSDPQRKPHETHFRQHRECVDCGRINIGTVKTPQ